MSVVNKVWAGGNWAYQLRKKLMPGMTTEGLLSVFGMDPIKRTAAGATVLQGGGMRSVMNQDGTTSWSRDGDTGFGAMGSSAMGVAFGGLSVGISLFTEGPLGAIRQLMIETAGASGVNKHGFLGINNADGGQDLVYGGIGRRMMGKLPGAAAVGVGEYAMKQIGSGIAGQAVYHALGGGFMATPFAMMASYHGAKYGGVITMGAIAYTAAKYTAAGAGAILKAGNRYTQSKRAVQTDGDLAAFNTQGAYTMRARAVQAISRSHLNARSALGQEASLMHNPNTNYHSRYRY